MGTPFSGDRPEDYFSSYSSNSTAVFEGSEIDTIPWNRVKRHRTSKLFRTVSHYLMGGWRDVINVSQVMGTDRAFRVTPKLYIVDLCVCLRCS